MNPNLYDGCYFSPDRKYRYTLWRRWDTLTGVGTLMVIGLNPSTADETKDDPTIRRCIDYAQRWGYAGLCMVNLFAYRATLPADMKKAEDPIGPENDRVISELASESYVDVLVAWGRDGKHLDRDIAVSDLLGRVGAKCLGRNQDGTPVHPLYQPKTAKRVQWR